MTPTSRMTGNNAPTSRPACRLSPLAAATVPGEHQRAAGRHGFGGQRERARPHDADREPGQRAGDQSQERHGGQRGDQVGGYAKGRAGGDEHLEIEPMAEYAVDGAAQPHEHGERGRPARRTAWRPPRAHLPPAVERVQQAHRLVLVFGRAGVDDRGDHDFDQAAADGVQHDGGQQRRIRVGHARGQQAERQQTGRRGHMRGDDAGPVADAVHILAGQHIHHELRDEVHRDQHGQPGHVDAERGRERDEQQRHEVVDDRLRDIAVEAGDNGTVVVRRSCGHAETLLRVGAGRSDAVIVSMSPLCHADFRTSCPYGVFGGGAARVVGEEP